VFHKRVLFLVLLLVAQGCDLDEHKSDAPSTEGIVSPRQQANIEKEKLASVESRLQRLEQDVEQAIRDGDRVRAKQLIEVGLKTVEEQGAGFELNQARFILTAGNIARESGSEIDARRHFDDAMAIFHVHKDIEGRVLTYIAIGQLETRRGDYVAAARQLASAEKLMPGLKDRRLPGIFKLNMGRLASRQVKRAEAHKHFSEAIRIFSTLKDKQDMAEALLLLASEEDAMGRTRASKNSIEKALRIFRRIENIDGEAQSLHRLAVLAEREKKYQRARKLLLKVYGLYDKLDRKSAATAVMRHINALPEDK
jgi:tetratricopeptide (TPR) repeat protein